ERGREVGTAQWARPAASARLRGTGARALERSSRAVPDPLRRGEHAGDLPDDTGTVLPCATAPDAQSAAKAARRDDSEVAPPPPAGGFTHRPFHERPVRAGSRRPDVPGERKRSGCGPEDRTHLR